MCVGGGVGVLFAGWAGVLCVGWVGDVCVQDKLQLTSMEGAAMHAVLQCTGQYRQDRAGQG